MTNRTLRIIALLASGATLAAGAGPAAALSPVAEVGKLIFNDVNLSASGKQSCASCHAPQNAMMAPNALSVQLGGAYSNLQGFRNVPSVTYALFIPPAAPVANNPAPPRGGLQLDGRALDLAAQAAMPFLAANEMANASSAEVQFRLLRRPYLAAFKAAFGNAPLSSPDGTLSAMARAVAAFEKEDPSFQQFSSKFDAALRGQARLSAQETRGLVIFNDPAKGNCIACHTSTAVNGQPPMFSNFTYHALGVPRNWAISYNRDDLPRPSFAPANGAALGAPNHQYYDMGLCGPFRSDLSGKNQFCGQFRVPSLRNVALKHAYFHNGVFGSLQQVVNFYNTRDITPAQWFKKVDGITPDIAYNDLPLSLNASVDRRPPFNPLPNGRPRLLDADVRAVVSLLCTLTDGYNPANPAAYPYPAQCKDALQ
jgi:cytochrome c peroxidase